MFADTDVPGAMRAQLRLKFSWLAPLAVLVAAALIKLTEAGGIPPALRSFFVSLIAAAIYDVPAAALRRPQMADPAELMFIAVAGMIIVVMFARRSVFAAGTATAASLAAWSVFAWGMTARWGALFDVFTVSFALVLVFAAGTVAAYAAGAEARARRTALATHLAPAILSAVAGRKDLFLLAPEKREITYLVCRIRNFSRLADAADGEALLAAARRLMRPLAGAVLDASGIIDRVHPGELTAFFNAPFDDPEHAIRACASALVMSEDFSTASRESASSHALAISIGIDSGTALVGDFGEFARPNYSAAGRTVDAASDLERIAAQYGVAVAVGESARARADRHFAFLELDLVPRGTEAPVAIYGLVGAPSLRASPKFRALQSFHQRIFQAYRARDWARARILIGQCRALSGASGLLYDFYLDRIAHYERHPPGEMWDGAFRRAST